MRTTLINGILFRMEMRRNLRSLSLWTLMISLLIFFTMSFFRSVVQYQQQITGMVQLVPAAVIKLRGFSNITDIFTALGFYTANNLIYMMLLGSIYSIILSSNILLKEEYGKTAEYLMSRPISRNSIFATKTAVILINTLILNVVATITGLAAIQVFRTGDFPAGAFFSLSGYTFLLNLLFGMLGLFISVLMRRARPVTSSCVGLVMVLYFVYTISRMSGVDGRFGYISPFKWLNINVMSPGYGIDLPRLAAFAGTALALCLMALFFYRRKDILS